MNLQENIPLASRTTFGIGGPARWFAEASSEAEVAEACAWARARDLPLFVLGGGSNLLVADAGFHGLVLCIALAGIALDGDRLQAAAGEPWERCVEQATEAGLAGIECLAGIPGSVGGTPVQNVGAYGQEVGAVIERVRTFDRAAQKFVEFPNVACGFAYRRSRFNSADRGRFVVTRVDYRLRPGGAPALGYADLERHFAHHYGAPTLVEVAEAVRAIRRAKGMFMIEGDPDCRSAGSFFKNPAVAPEAAERIRAIAGAVRAYPASDGLVKISAAWLIEQAGFAPGFALGAAGISSRHTLALVNRGGATAAEILALAETIRSTVEQRFGIRLEMEPDRVGFD